MTHIRPANMADLDTLFLLEKTCFPHDFWQREALSSHLQSPICLTYLFCEGEVVKGALLLQCICPEFEVLRVEVNPSARRQGIGRALLQYAHKQLLSEGYIKGFLEVRASNQSAISLYGVCGYTAYGKRKDYYSCPTEDGVLMQIDFSQ
ncbi:MAG: GNAT family N-acetyltransferase [Clostridia bacterium]|nr:GNAT family N-acetyltransferase [Clostridia bacterium]